MHVSKDEIIADRLAMALGADVILLLPLYGA
jgi:hypothetical protein